MPNTIYIPDKTWTDLKQVPKFQKFMKEYIDLLQKKLKKVEVRGNSHNSFYYTCGQIHDRRNPAWHPFKLLSWICKKYGYDHLLAKEIIEDRIGRNLECECQIINNNAERRRKELINNFGADLGGPGRRDFDIF